MLTSPTYVTDGAVRGACGHRHRTLAGAERCLARDQAGCATQGGYSDRSIYRMPGRDLMVPDGDGGYAPLAG